MTTEECYNDFIKKLSSIYEKREAANITDWVFENITGLKRLERSMVRNVELDESVLHKSENYLHELLQHKPVQYVLHEAWFYKMKFYVNEHVLIPRPETEELVEWAVNDIKNSKQKDGLEILDIGTGSGCIAISIKKELEGENITAIDISAEALKVANKNADTLQSKIYFLETDFLNESKWDSLGVYDIIVSNPPYIPKYEKDKLARNVTAFEPGIALFVEDNNPFIFYKKIAKFAQSHLKPGGKVFVEMHEDYSKEVAEIFWSFNLKTQTRKDIYGKERMLQAM